MTPDELERAARPLTGKLAFITMGVTKDRLSDVEHYDMTNRRADEDKWGVREVEGTRRETGRSGRRRRGRGVVSGVPQRAPRWAEPPEPQRRIGGNEVGNGRDQVGR
jgi:hypothetical protein